MPCSSSPLEKIASKQNAIGGLATCFEGTKDAACMTHCFLCYLSSNIFIEGKANIRYITSSAFVEDITPIFPEPPYQ